MSAQAAASQAMNTLNIVSTQIQNLLNVHVTKYVNTGDRVVDNGVTLIVNSCIALLGAYLYSAIIQIASWVYNRHVVKRKPETDDPTDIDIAVFDYSKYTTDNIIKYKITCVLPASRTCVNQIVAVQMYTWLNHTFKVINTHKQLEIYNSCAEVFIANKNSNSTCLHGYFMPVWKYKTAAGEWDYVWLVDSALYSNDHHAIEQCIQSIYKYVYINPSKSATTETVTTEVRQCNIYCLTPVGNNLNGNVILLGKMNPKKTFNSIFYDKKQCLINTLNNFLAEKMYPDGMCDNKLGILLYGPPGTGKTGTITALANYTKRDVYMVKHTTKADIEFLKSLIDRTGLNKMIIVFDEFDHILCGKKPTNLGAEYLKEYKIKELREELRDTPEDDKEERKRILQEIKDLKENKQVDKSEEISTADLLQFLDGIEDQTGRLIVATTNYPDKINPILLRPGRFDLKLELGYCSMQMFHDIVQKVFPDDIDRLADIVHTQTVVAVAAAEAATSTDKPDATIEVTHTQTIPIEQYIARLLEKKITPLNLINSCLKAASFAELIELMEALEPDTFTYTK